ncbi:type II toxin-antitoxin system Phd/YefM family antitoxin [Candidatus Saccharibacteria bacterium]|nr:MAG: type II toxin-antitoxin system Phd/YefM family antitoxin [Candidatus Saccharibacteria bacterium]
MQPISITEAKRTFEELVERVKAGEAFVITRYGKPAAVMCQPSAEDNAKLRG